MLKHTQQLKHAGAILNTILGSQANDKFGSGSFLEHSSGDILFTNPYASGARGCIIHADSTLSVRNMICGPNPGDSYGLGDMRELTNGTLSDLVLQG